MVDIKWRFGFRRSLRYLETGETVARSLVSLSSLGRFHATPVGENARNLDTWRISILWRNVSRKERMPNISAASRAGFAQGDSVHSRQCCLLLPGLGLALFNVWGNRLRNALCNRSWFPNLLVFLASWSLIYVVGQHSAKYWYPPWLVDLGLVADTYLM